VVAFETMRKMIDERPSVTMYNIFIHGLVKCGQHENARKVYDKMIQSRVKPNVYTFNIELRIKKAYLDNIELIIDNQMYCVFQNLLAKLDKVGFG